MGLTQDHRFSRSFGSNHPRVRGLGASIKQPNASGSLLRQPPVQRCGIRACPSHFCSSGDVLPRHGTCKFSLGYSPLATGIRIGPIAATLLLVAPLSVLLAHRIGTKAVVAVGLALVVQDWFSCLERAQQPRISVTSPRCCYWRPRRSCDGSMHRVSDGLRAAIGRGGVGSATNDTAMQIGGGSRCGRSRNFS